MNTPYAVLCPGAPGRGCLGGRQYLMEQEYDRQMSNPNSLWTCPNCGNISYWDYDNYEEHTFPSEQEEVAF
jgi:hypothetical protein